MSLWRIAVVVVVCGVLAAEAPAAPPGCALLIPTFAAERDTPNTVIVIGHVQNAQKTDTGETTEFVIGRALQTHPALAGKSVVTMARFIKIPDPKNPPRFVAFGGIKDGKIDIYRGLVETPELVRYIEGLLKIDTKDRAKLLRYAFDYLEPKGTDAASDALAVFESAAEADVRTAAERLDPEVLRKWLRNDPDHKRTSLYARLLGHCGKPEDTALFRELLADPDRTINHGLLVGYILLDKKAGHNYLTNLLADPEQEFVGQHAGLRALRYFWADRPGVLTRKEVLGGMLALMTHPDIADMPIEDLRRWKVWELTPQVLHLAALESHAVLPINRRAILKYALAASQDDPKNKAAVEFVAQARKDDPDRVNLLEEWLADEAKALREVAPAPRQK